MELGDVEIEGLRIGYARAGSGPPLLILPGAFDDHHWWEAQLDRLSDEFTVIVWDAPGVGRSSDVPDGFRLADFADCVAGLAAALAIGRLHLLGLSFGSGLALEVYHRHPQLPRSLVLSGAYAGWGGSLPPDEVARRVALSDRMPDMAIDDVVAAWLPTLVTDATPPGEVERIRTLLSAIRLAAAPTTGRAFAEADLQPMLGSIAVPTLLLHGDADVRSSLAVAEELHARIPGAQLVVLPGVGHLANLDAPERFNAEVRRFLRAVS